MRFFAIAAILSLGPGIGARAQTTIPSYVFVTVDAVSSENNARLKITGMEQGQAAATELAFLL